jgi:hypothetical protein
LPRRLETGSGLLAMTGVSEMKPINVWPMLIMLVAVVFLILWLNGFFR